MKTPLIEYWKILENMEDFLKDGIRRVHPDPPLLGRGRCRTGADSMDSLESIAREIGSCTACELAGSRNHVVPGEGSETGPLVMIIGEAPGGGGR